MTDRNAETAEGIRQLEGYLLLEAERAAARRSAEDFADKLPWLVPDQREEVVRLYASERMTLTRRTLEHIASRCEELRGEYGHRYEQLRRRLLCRHLALFLTTAAVYVTLRALG